MRLDRLLMATLGLFSLGSIGGCTDEVGTCDPTTDDGTDTVMVGNQVQFAGQAIINQACAGCHSSTAKGAARRGAPAGLDFDLYPIQDPTMMTGTGTNERNQKIVNIKSEATNGLRERQRMIFEERHLIWQQVKDELMPPPGGIGAAFRSLSSIVGTDDKRPCQADTVAFGAVTDKSARDAFRRWLACRAPVVEVNTDVLGTDKSNSSYNGDAGFSASEGEAGYQYLVCESDAGTGPASFDRVYGDVLRKCAECHQSGSISPALDTIDTAYMALLGGKSMYCGTKSLVVAGDPAKSFLYEVVSSTPSCTAVSRMPEGRPQLTAAEQKLIYDWIAAGAKRMPDATQQSALTVGLDAGLPEP